MHGPLDLIRADALAKAPKGFWIAASLLVLYVGWKTLRHQIMKRYTAVPDLEYLRKPRKAPKLSGTCFIAGGSISGLLAASVCAKHYEKVVMIESESYTPGQTEPRKHVLQYQQLHTFLALVTNTLEGIYPDIKDRIRAYGGRIGDFIFPFYLGDKLRMDPDEYSTETIYLSRQGMETVLRELVAERCPNVEIMYKASVTGVDVTNGRITRALVRRGDNIEKVDCALFLDCTGPALGSTKWLPKVGYTAPKVLKYNPHVVYATAVFDLSKLKNREEFDPQVGPKDGFILGVRPACGVSRYSGFLSRIENDTLLVTANMWNGDEGLPKDLAAFPSYFAKMPHWPEHIRLLQELVDTQPETPVWKVKPPPCHRVQWLDVDVPDNFIPVGDVMQKLNAQYGQGCSQASLCVTTLNKLLFSQRGRVEAGFGKRYIRRVFDRITYLWDASRLTDYGWANTVPCEGETLEKGAFERWLQEIVITAMCIDPKVTRHIYDGSAQVMAHNLLEVLSPRLLYWIARLSIFGPPTSYPEYRKQPRKDLPKLSSNRLSTL